jgi:hypothetical protein
MNCTALACKKSVENIIYGQDGLLLAQPIPFGFAWYRVSEEQANPVNWRKTAGFSTSSSGAAIRLRTAPENEAY